MRHENSVYLIKLYGKLLIDILIWRWRFTNTLKPEEYETSPDGVCGPSLCLGGNLCNSV